MHAHTHAHTHTHTYTHTHTDTHMSGVGGRNNVQNFIKISMLSLPLTPPYMYEGRVGI